MARYSLSAGLESTIDETTFLARSESLDSYDIVIRFLSAEVGHLEIILVHDNIRFHRIYRKQTWSDMLIRILPQKLMMLLPIRKDICNIEIVVCFSLHHF